MAQRSNSCSYVWGLVKGGGLKRRKCVVSGHCARGPWHWPPTLDILYRGDGGKGPSLPPLLLAWYSALGLTLPSPFPAQPLRHLWPTSSRRPSRWSRRLGPRAYHAPQ